VWQLFVVEIRAFTNGRFVAEIFPPFPLLSNFVAEIGWTDFVAEQLRTAAGFALGLEALEFRNRIVHGGRTWEILRRWTDPRPDRFMAYFLRSRPGRNLEAAISDFVFTMSQDETDGLFGSMLARARSTAPMLPADAFYPEPTLRRPFGLPRFGVLHFLVMDEARVVPMEFLRSLALRGSAHPKENAA